MDSINLYKEKFKKALLELNRLEVTSILEQVKGYQDKTNFVEDILVPVLEEIGDGWEDGTVALSQVYISGRICEELIEVLYPQTHDEANDKPTIAIVTYDDFHPLGKKIVYSTLKASGVYLLDYGFGVDDQELIKRIERDNIEILIMSVLMLPTVFKIKDFKNKLRASGLDTKILVGGAPFRFDSELWKMLEVDAMARTPIDTLNIIKQWEETSDE
ncbi:MAG: cobalamin-dependent protein [Clostridiales bacterium]|nr:cobalamin-dependent protein [Clostridiales bacterium]